MIDEKFENYLREFEPKKPRALPIELSRQKTTARPEGWKRLVAAAAIALMCGASLLNGLKEKPLVSRDEASEKFAGQKKTVFELTKAALDDSAAFEAAAEKESRKILPRLDGPDSALRVLARE